MVLHNLCPGEGKYQGIFPGLPGKVGLSSPGESIPLLAIFSQCEIKILK